MKALAKAIEIAGGQAALAQRICAFHKARDARDCRVRQQHVSSWLNRTHEVPAIHVLAIEWATDRQVTRHELRPDLYPIEDLPRTGKVGLEAVK